MAADSLLQGFNSAMHGSGITDERLKEYQKQALVSAGRQVGKSSALNMYSNKKQIEALKRIEANEILKEFVENMKDDE